MARSPKTYRVVIDTNIFVSAVLVKQGNPNRLLRSWQQGQIQLIALPGLIAEVERTLHLARIQRKYQVPEDDIQELLANLAEAEEGVAQEEIPLTSRDVKDNPFLAIALGSGADYLVTGDDDLLVLSGDPALGNLQIVTVRVFLSVLEQSEGE